MAEEVKAKNKKRYEKQRAEIEAKMSKYQDETMALIEKGIHPLPKHSPREKQAARERNKIARQLLDENDKLRAQWEEINRMLSGQPKLTGKEVVKKELTKPVEKPAAMPKKPAIEPKEQREVAKKLQKLKSYKIAALGPRYSRPLKKIRKLVTRGIRKLSSEGKQMILDALTEEKAEKKREEETAN